MAVASPQLRDDGLHADTVRIALAEPIGDLVYPETCPNCSAAASRPISITKIFSHNSSDSNGADSSGWQHREASAAPLFCAACVQRHHAEEEPVTTADRLKSVFLTELALPAAGTLAFGLFLLKETGAKIARDPGREWVLALIIGVLLFIGLMCLRAAWVNNAYRRVPRQTQTSLAFDFGDDPSTVFKTVPRTYALRNADYAADFAALNADRSQMLLGPAQRRTETKRTIVTGAIILTVAVLGWWFSKG